MTENELRDAIYAYVEEHDFVTFAALHREFAGDAKEPTEISLPGNRIIWLGLPKPVIDAVLGLLAEGFLAAIPGHIAAYRRDGRVLPMAVEKYPPREPHDPARWLPVLLRTMEAARADAPEEDEDPTSLLGG